MYVKINNQSCIKVLTKVGSHSMYDSFATLATTQISAEEAINLPVRIMFVRHPITRLASAFNHFYWLALDSMYCEEFIAPGVITAYGQRVRGNVSRNEWKHLKYRKLDYDRVISEMADSQLTQEDLATKLDHDDWKRFVDFVLSNAASDEHWMPQLSQAKLNGQLVPNVAHRFEDVTTHWNKYVGGQLPHENAWSNIQKPTYRIDELNDFYREDLEFWEAINGTWNAN